MDILINTQIWASLITLTILEIVLGIDNLVFLTIISGRLPPHQQQLGRQIGLCLALVLRLLLLATANLIIHMTTPLFSVFDQAISARDILLLAGGLFLIMKGTNEIHAGFVNNVSNYIPGQATIPPLGFASAVLQITIFDMVFSFDSVITAVGMAQNFVIMAIAIIIAIIAMLFASKPLGRFIEKYPSLKMLALSFLILIGVVLLADGLDFHVPRGYIYFSIAFSIAVEVLNICAGKRRLR